MDPIGELTTFVLNAAYRVPAILLAAAGLELMLRKAPARYRHGLWVMALAASLATPFASLRAVRESRRTVAPPLLPAFSETRRPEVPTTEPAVVGRRPVSLPLNASLSTMLAAGWRSVRLLQVLRGVRSMRVGATPVSDRTAEIASGCMAALGATWSGSTCRRMRSPRRRSRARRCSRWSQRTRMRTTRWR